MALFLILLGIYSDASVTSMRFSPQQKIEGSRWIYGEGAAPRKGALIDLKKAQIEQDWPRCVNLAATAKGQAKSLRPWVLNAELSCAQNLKIETSSVAILHKVLKSAESNLVWLTRGPAAEELSKNYVATQLVALDVFSKFDRAKAWPLSDQLMEQLNSLDKKQKAKLFRLIGELSFMQQKLQAAREFIYRSLQEEESAELREKVRSVEAALGLPSREDKKPEVSAEITTADSQVEASSGEIEWVQRITTAIQAGDLLPAFEDAISLIREFPGGSRAKWAADRIQENLLMILDRQDEKYLNLREKFLRVVEGAGRDRLFDWGRVLYNRGFYCESFRLLKKSVADEPNFPAMSAPLELAGDAAVSCEKWKDALQFYSRLVNFYSGTADSKDALLKAALVHYRIGESSQAVSLLEKLLVLPQLDSLELTARYWHWRALQEIKSERAALAADELMKKFPFSYYGIRARAETQGQVFLWNKDARSKLVVEAWMTDSERLALERIQLLLANGWLDEAQSELKFLPLPIRPEEKAVRARFMAAALMHTSAARIINQVWDQDWEFRLEPYLSVGFPNEFMPMIKKFSQAKNLDSLLVLSLMKQESGFSPKALSTSNAMGLMQIIEPTAREIAGDLSMRNLQIPNDMFKPQTNIQMGTHYVAKMLARFNQHVPLALSGYNAGPFRTDKWLKARPGLKDLMLSRSSQPRDELWIDELPWKETQVYIKSILRNLVIYRMLEKGRVELKDPIWN